MRAENVDLLMKIKTYFQIARILCILNESEIINTMFTDRAEIVDTFMSDT